MQTKFIRVILIILLLIFAFPTSSQIDEFTFTNTLGNTESISDYSSKPIILDWAASWCSICKENQRTFNELYQTYKEDVNFISISFGGSGDTIEDVISMKGSYQWTFGLDHQNIAADFNVRNGYVWILNTDLTLFREWEYTIVQKSDLLNSIQNLIGDENFDTQNDFQNEPNNQNERVNSFGLESNPLFLIFLGSILLVISFLIIKGGNNSTEDEGEEDLLKKYTEKAKQNWDWYEE